MRLPVDVAWGDLRTQVELHVRRFHCETQGCTQQIFTEQLPGFVRRYARRTERLDNQLLLTYVAGGQAGSMLAEHFKIPISPDTLLRLIRRSGASKDLPTPRVSILYPDF